MSKVSPIAEVKTYVDTEGRKVYEFTEVMGGKDKGNVTYKGHGVMMARSMNSQAPGRQIPFEFPFPEGTTLKQAFETFDELAQKSVAEFQKQQAQQIVGARSMPSFLGPDGKPLKAGG